ncbi:transcription termination factor Rho [candidate division KSB1 bacterium]|nr:transcription termination factor Rho [candidate division KSB1 bacterium]RQW11482.1 MAG: transcription termination factor Rho [candidate division KSB1 bacterium]
MSKVTGIFQQPSNKAGFLRNPKNSLRPSPADISVPPSLVKEHNLVNGARVTGTTAPVKDRQILATIESICGVSPHAYKSRTPYQQLTAIDPCARFHLDVSNQFTMRAIDLIAPIGRGTRALIVSPPKAGKTTILENIAKAVYADAPETRIIALLIDERPEEVTMFRRSVPAEVLASSSDQSVAEHVELAELALAHIRAELECGQNVVVLVDSLTRMGRAFNLKGTGRGRTMSGGVEVGALEFPRRFFGLARKIEDGGSVTIIATALIDTGSRMDDLIFEEFKGTGNCEIVLDRNLANSYIFPAIDITRSGTRKEACLYTPDENARLVQLRRLFADQDAKTAMQYMIRLLEKFPSNQEILQSIPLGG